MKRIRIQMILLACWLVIFYSVEHFLEPINISRFSYAFVLAVVVLALIVPRLTRIPLWFILTAPVVVFLVFKTWLGTEDTGNVFTITIIEVSVILVATLLAYGVSVAISEFEGAIAHITIGRRDKLAETSVQGQSSLYREVRRARNHQRPLALMAIGVEEKSIKVALDKMVQEAQLVMMRQYTLSGVSKTLCDKLEDCAILVQNDDHFLVLLPETVPEDLPRLVERLRQEVAEKVGVDLRVGMASLPQDGFTYEGLLEKATHEMTGDASAQLFIEFGRVSVKHNVT